MAAMTFLQMQNEIVNLRFGEPKRLNAVLWIQHRYRQVFGLRDWPFRQVSREPVTTGAGGSITTASPLRRAYALELASGDSLAYISPREMRTDYKVGTALTGPPQVYTQIGGLLQTQPPLPSGASVFVSYQRAVCCFDDHGLIRAGALSGAADTPLWPEEHHYLLVLGGMATGLKNVNDPTWESLEQEYQLSIDAMIDDLMPPDLYGTTQYGRQSFA